MPRRQIKFILTLSISLIILSSAPYIYGYFVKPADTSFLGNGLFNPHDLPVYYSYIGQVKEGHWLFKDVFTAEPNQKPFLNIFWLAVGLLARITNLDPIWAFHLARIILIPLFVFTVFKFIKLAFANDKEEERKTKIALIFFFFSTGLGGLLVFFQNSFRSPVEVWWPEAYAFLSNYASPHFIASWILIIASFYFLIKAFQEGKNRNLIYGGLLAALLCQFHTFYLALIAPISFIFAFYYLFGQQKKAQKIFWQTFIFNLFLLPIVIYYFFLIKNDPVLWARFNNQMPSPPVLLVIFIFGLNIILAFIQIFNYFRSGRRQIATDFIIVWAISVPFLLYAPLPFQRRLVEGWQLPIIILATGPLVWIMDKLVIGIKLIDRYYKYALIFIPFFLSTCLIWIFTFAIYKNIDTRLIYLPQNIKKGLTWLKNENTSRDSVILAASYTGLVATFIADKTVFWGHYFETVNSLKKADALTWLLGSNGQDKEKKKFLKIWRVEYLFWGPFEKKSSNFQPQEKNYLKEIYNQEGVQIYQVYAD